MFRGPGRWQPPPLADQFGHNAGANHVANGRCCMEVAVRHLWRHPATRMHDSVTRAAVRTLCPSNANRYPALGYTTPSAPTHTLPWGTPLRVLPPIPRRGGHNSECYPPMPGYLVEHSECSNGYGG